MVTVSVPDIGNFKDVPVIEIHVKPGDNVSANDPLVTLESDKAAMEVLVPGSRRCGTSPGEAWRHGQYWNAYHTAERRRRSRCSSGCRHVLRASARSLPSGRRPQSQVPCNRGAVHSRPRRSLSRTCGFRRGAREPRGAQAGARARHRSDENQRHRRQGTHHQGRHQAHSCVASSRLARRGKWGFP